MENKDIIIVGLQDWDTGIGSNCKNIALEFAKKNRVLYVNYPFDWITRLREKESPVVIKRIDVVNGKEDQLKQVGESLWSFYPSITLDSINWIGSKKMFGFFNKKNNYKYANEILKAVRQLNFRNYYLFNDNDIFRSFHLKEYLNPVKSIYYIRDFLLSVPYWKKHGSKLEPELIKKSDAVVTNSLYLKNYAAQFSPDSFYVGQGCETDLFRHDFEYEVPADMKNIKKPVVGYIGALFSLRLDIELIVYLSQSLPEINFVFVGPEDQKFKESELHKMQNVHSLGSKEVAQLPSYMANFDVCINPQIVNDVTIGNYPRKVDEYLSMGKPVVATSTDAMQIFKDHVYLAKLKEEFKKMILSALNEKDESLINKRVSLAKSHTWENSVQKIYEVMSEGKIKNEHN